MAIFSSIADIVILRRYRVLVRKCVRVSARGKIMWMDSIKKKEKLCFKHSVLADVMVPVKRSNVSVRSTRYN